MTDATIRGLQEAQRWNQRAIAAMKPGGSTAQGLQWFTSALHRFAVARTHVQTGALRASEREQLDFGALRSRLYIDPSATNPRSGVSVLSYAADEDDKGGDHAFYGETYRTGVPQYLGRASEMIWRGMQ